MFEVHLEWQLPGDPESTKLKIGLPLVTPSVTNQFQTYSSEDVAKSYEAGYQAATEAHEASDNWKPNYTTDADDRTTLIGPEPFVSSPISIGPAPLVNQRGLPLLQPYDGPRKQKNHPTTRDVRTISRLLKQGYTYDEIVAATRFGKTTIARISNGTHSPMRRGTRPAAN